MPDVAAGVVGGKSEVSADRGDRRLLDRIDVDVGMRGRPRWKGFAALAGVGDRRNPSYLRRHIRGRPRTDLGLRRQAIPRELFGERIRLHLVHLAPAVDGSRWAGRDAIIAEVALVSIHDVVARVMRNRVRWTRLLARVAADADFGVDEVLPQHLHHGSACAHLVPRQLRAQLKRTYSKSSGWLSMPRAGGAIQLANLPGSTTRPISDATNARSAGLGSQRSTLAVHSAGDTTLPSGSTCASVRGPIRRWKALCGTLKRNGMPVFSMTRFQRSTPAAASRI